MSDLYPGSYQVLAMKYGKAPEGEKLMRELASGKYIAQPKKDGYFYELEKTDDGQLYFFSRSKSRVTKELTEKLDHVPHLAEWAKQLPNGTILCGEIYYPNGTSKDVTKVMGALADKAIARQKENGLLHYYIFDIIRYNKEWLMELPFEQRYSLLCEHIDIECDNPDWLEVAPSKTGFDMYDTIQSWIAAGGEGAVVKDKSGTYKADKRPTYNFKVKKATDNIDFVITKILDPEYYYTGKEPDTWQYKDNDGKLITKAAYYNWAGAIQVGAYDDAGKFVAVGRVASGLTDEMKEDMAKNPDKYIGQVCEVQAMSLDKDALTFRHPFFVRMRPDKPAEDCKISEIFS